MEKSFGLLEENRAYLNRLYFSINFHGDFFFFFNFLLKNGKRITIKTGNSPFTDDICHADLTNSVQFYLRINPYLIPKIEWHLENFTRYASKTYINDAVVI